VIDPTGKVIREEPIKVEHGPSVHDCAITATYVVILDLPVTFSMKALIAGHRFPYRWNPEHRARVGLLPRAGGDADVIWCEVDPAYVFHVANAYDLPDGRVTMDVCAYQTMFADHLQGPDALPRGLERWTIDPAARRVDIEMLDPSPQEFPRPDERRFGQPHRYVYSVALGHQNDPRFLATALYRHDLQTRSRQTHEFGSGRHPGEFVFTPKAPDSAEGQGWLMGLVIDLDHETTDLVILDAERFEDAPVARVRIPHRVPPGFHGNWLPD
jgi:carotenoid cleavage dioxygenase